MHSPGAAAQFGPHSVDGQPVGLTQALLLHEALLGEVERGIWDAEQPMHLLG